MKKKLLLFLLIIIVFLGKDNIHTNGIAVYRISYGVKISAPAGSLKTFRICIPLPDEDSHQIIRSIKLASEVKPAILIKSKKHTLKYYYFRLEKYLKIKNSISLIIHTEVQKKHKSFNTYAGSTGSLLTNSPFYRYSTRSDRYSDSGLPEVKKLAKQISGLNAVNAARLMFSKMRTILEIKPRFLGLSPLSEILKRRSGECSDFSLLFVAVLRAAGIPARIVVGRVLTPDVKKSFHIWAEFYTVRHGWIPCDPFYFQRDKLLFGYQPEDYLVIHRDTGIPAPPGEIIDRLPMLQTYYYFYNSNDARITPEIEYIWSSTKK